MKQLFVSTIAGAPISLKRCSGYIFFCAIFTCVFFPGSLSYATGISSNLIDEFQSGSNALRPLIDQNSGKLFGVQGSNTIGATLMKSLLQEYLQAKGAKNIQSINLPVDNEYRIQGVVGESVFYIDVAAHGSSTGFKGLLANKADLAMSSRRAKESEVENLMFLGDLRSADCEQVIAIDGLAIIVNARNSVSSLNLEQIARVFSGEINDWAQLGGESGKINIYARDENSGTWDTFSSLVLGDAYLLSSSTLRLESNDELSDLVASDTHGIGFVGLASVRNSVGLAIYESGTQPLVPKKLVVATEDYPLSRRLFLYTPSINPNPLVREFIEFVHSDKGQSIVESTGFVSQNLISLADQADHEGPQDYVDLVKNAQRLSVNFRFKEGSAQLDNKALRDITRIVSYAQRPENQHKKLTLVGFGDQKQSESRSKVLSKLRAIEVKTALIKAGVSTGPVWGFGAYLPVAGNNSSGRLKNQRVEVWVEEDQE